LIGRDNQTHEIKPRIGLTWGSIFDIITR